MIIFSIKSEDYLKAYYKFDINFFDYSGVVRNDDYFDFG